MCTSFRGEYIMKEIHEDICGNHVGGQSLAFKIIRQGYYLPIMKADYMEFAQNVISVSGSHQSPRHILRSSLP